ncbi:MAG: hypothetical protein ACYCOO_00395 [Chitinophagaceae bacterium]
MFLLDVSRRTSVLKGCILSLTRLVNQLISSRDGCYGIRIPNLLYPEYAVGRVILHIEAFYPIENLIRGGLPKRKRKSGRK